MKRFSLFTLGLVAWAVASVWLELTPLQAGLLLCLYLALCAILAVAKPAGEFMEAMNFTNED